MDSERMIDALPASTVLDMLLQTHHFYFPEAFRERYEHAATFFETKEQLYWIERARARTADLRVALKKLGEWDDIPEPDLLMMSWDDELLFFYILRTQWVFARIAGKPHDMLPGRMDEFWEWSMTVKDDEPWMLYPVMTAAGLKAAPVKPPIWRIPYPSDYPEKA